MPDWLILSIAGSIILTIAVNLLPMLFPKTARRAQEKMIEEFRDRHASDDNPGRPGSRLRVFFPWKALLIGSVVLTLIWNIIWVLARP